tara:strand:+ start:354 stop:551 length:198 start_codon:yes stop_codon:yes gene_type:complete
MEVEGKPAAVIVLPKLDEPLVKSGTSKKTGQPYRLTNLYSNMYKLNYQLEDGTQVQVNAGIVSFD